MKPTITNAFNTQSIPSADTSPDHPENWPGNAPRGNDDKATFGAPSNAAPNPKRNLAGSLSPMQADLREAEFGWSMELSPMQAVDALQALAEHLPDSTEYNYLVTLEQSAWRDGEEELSLSAIADRLAVAPLEQVNESMIVVDQDGLQELVCLCESSRLLVVAVDGMVDARDAKAMCKAIDEGKSPLRAELRAVWAVEVVGNRSLVLHSRSKVVAHAVVAANFQHYLAALLSKPTKAFAAPQPWQVERLLDHTGIMTVRPIETQIESGSIDVGVNTTRDRFTQPANQSLVFDRPSNSWHDEG